MLRRWSRAWTRAAWRLPSLDYYLDNSDRFKELRAKYVQHIQKMFELAGDPSDKAAADAKTVMEIETALAKASMDNVTRRDPKAIYNKRSLQQLKAAVPDFGWDEYLQLMGAPSVPFYIVSTPAFLRCRGAADQDALPAGLASLPALVGAAPWRFLRVARLRAGELRLLRHHAFRYAADAAAMAALRRVNRPLPGRSAGAGVRQHCLSAGEQAARQRAGEPDSRRAGGRDWARWTG